MEWFMGANEALFERRKNVVANGISTFVPMTVAHASGAVITDLEGKSYIDFGGGIGVLNAGHCPPEVVEAIKAQAEKLIHACFHISTYEVYVELCEKLVELIPHGENTKVMLTTTGAESVENAIKIARQATKRQAVICYSEAFHGRSMMGMTLTSNINYKRNCGPFASEVYRIDFPNFYQRGSGLTLEEFSIKEINKLESFITSNVEPGAVAAIIIEPIQGEGGFNIAPKSYLESLRKFCDKYGIVLIFDEVQSGFCRTGKWGAFQHYGVTPDLSTWAKSMGSGMPIGAVIGKQAVMDAALAGTIGGTYLGNPICCAAALATISVMEDKKLNERAIEIGNYVTKRFESMATWADCIGDIRGLGAMVAMEIVSDKTLKIPHTELCKKLTDKCLEQGLVLLKAGSSKNVIRVLSPLVITDSELERAMNIIEKNLKEVIGEENK
mgnify:CR=1 FL=1